MKIIFVIIILFITLIFAGCQPTPGQSATRVRASPEPPLTASPRPLPTITVTPRPSPAFAASVEVAESTPSAAISSADISPTDLAHGIDLYLQSYCGVCHTLTAAGTRGTFGPSQDNMGVTAEQRLQDPDYKGSATTAEEYLLESLVDPQAYVVDGYELTRHKMPPFTHLSDEALQAIVQLLLHQK